MSTTKKSRVWEFDKTKQQMKTFINMLLTGMRIYDDIFYFRREEYVLGRRQKNVLKYTEFFGNLWYYVLKYTK